MIRTGRITETINRRRKQHHKNRRKARREQLRLETLEPRKLLASAAGTPLSLGSIHTNGDGGDFEYYASGNDDNFSEYGVASFGFDKTDFGVPGNQEIDDITSADYTLTYNDRSFTDGDTVEVFVTTQEFAGDYSGLSYDSGLVNGIDASQYSSAPVSLGTFAFDPAQPGGTQFTYSLDFDAAGVESAIISKLNSGGEFNLIIGVTDATHDITFSGLDNTFDPGDPLLELNVSTTPIADAVPPSLAGLSPADDASNVATDTHLIATFDELVQAGTGNIVVKQASDNSVVETIDVTSSQVTFDGATVTVDLAGDLSASTDYYVQIDSTAIEDFAGNAFAGIADTTTWNFTSEIADLPPVVLENGPFQVSDQAPAGTVVGDVNVDNDGVIDGGVTYELLSTSPADSMAAGRNGYEVEPLFTVGSTIAGTSGALNSTTAGDYTPPGVLDGLGAYELNEHTVRVLANHELLNFRGYDYEVSDGAGGTFTLDGARISYFDIDKKSKSIVDAGLAYHTIYDANGNIASDPSFLANDFAGFSRFCSAALFEAEQFGRRRGLNDRIYFTGEEDGGFFNGVGGGEWALDPDTGNLWHVPAMGRGAWENITEIDTGTRSHVAFILADDTSPFDFNPNDADGDEAAPLFLYVGKKQRGDFLDRNGLRDGKLFVWVPDDSTMQTPLEFNTAGTLGGSWVEVDNTPQPANGSEDGSTGFDEFGYPTQGNLWLQAKAAGAFGFSRPEDVSTNPNDGSEIVLASTGVDTYAIDPDSGDGADSFGTLYTVKVDFTNLHQPTADVTILYDGDADSTRALRSPDNLDWSDDGFIYVQEDEAEEDTLASEEPLFGDGAANPNEASIVRIDPATANITQVAEVDRSVVLDNSLANPLDAVDVDAGFAGEWETSGIIDVSSLFDEEPGSLFLFNVQAHGIEDQDDFNPESRLHDDDLVEGGQLSWLRQKTSMAVGESGYKVQPLFTVGDTFEDTRGRLNRTTRGDYTPPGVLDGLGAYQLNRNTVRVLANHELLNFRGYDYEVFGRGNETYTLDGARISYFDIDRATLEIVDAGLAYKRIYDANGNLASDPSFLANDFAGFSRFCSAALFEAEQFGRRRGLNDRIYFTGEEDGGFFNSVGGGEWALDPDTGNLWHVPAMGRGAWENITEIDTGTRSHVAFILADDTSPFDFNPNDADGDEAAPLFLYVGKKQRGDFLDRNGLRDGKLFVWVPDDSTMQTPLEFNTAGTLGGSWVEVDNTPQPANGSEDGSTGFDEFGYPTQGNLWLQAKAAGAFGFSRPEDVSTNPNDGSEIVLASTGVDTYAVDPDSGDGADSFGTLYTVKVDFTNLHQPTANVTILYDGDADSTRALRSPDNLDWSDDGFIYVQEDEAEEDTLASEEPLFGDGAANPNEASIVRVDPHSGDIVRVAEVDRSVVLDNSIADPQQAVDVDAGFAGEWETSGILDVSNLFDRDPGTLFLFNVQAHGIEDQDDFNPESRLHDDDLVEGGQLSWLMRKGETGIGSPFQVNPNTGVITVDDPRAIDAGDIAAWNLQLRVSDGVNTTTTDVRISVNDQPVVKETDVRFATFNASLNRGGAGDLIEDLQDGSDAQAQAIAEIIQRTSPDVILINEFDFDAGGIALQSFQDNYLEVSQNGADPVYYGYSYIAPSNTGIDSGLDLDNDGSVGGPGDAYGFGFFEGQFGMALLSRYPILTEQVRTFQNFLWKDMPGNLLPADPLDADQNGDFDHWYTTDELQAVRLSSKSHWDVPINVNGNVMHALVSHPTPPVFDGPEDRNGTRNSDEIRFWADYVTPGAGDYIYDDHEFMLAGGTTPAHASGGLQPGEAFVIMGDQNADPLDGDSTPPAISLLLGNPNINTSVTPSSLGGVENADLGHSGNPAFDTSDFNNPPGNLRVDYVLPSNNLSIEDAQVFWPEASNPLSLLVTASDHRLVWVDLTPQASATLHDGILAINGTNQDDTILVDRTFFSRKIVVRVNGDEIGRFDRRDVDKVQADGLMGDDFIRVSGRVFADTVLTGGDGNDTILGALFSRNVLVGGDGDDHLVGGLFRDSLIGGAGEDHLFGLTGRDLLIGGSTAYDLNDSALMGLLALRGPAVPLNLGTVFDDEERDWMSGGRHHDCLFAGLGDELIGSRFDDVKWLDGC